ncbi:MAG: AsnC family transcriptional regulator [Lachnospiraceae bacterium]|nr:AsnC family transcriptional regulator [Lachnospiraceae bacterium]
MFRDNDDERSVNLDETDEKILELLKDNARMTFQELGESVGMSRVAAKKRVHKLEERGIIRSYNTYIRQEGVKTIIADFMIRPEGYEEVLAFIAGQSNYVRQVYRTSLDNHIHMVASANTIQELRGLIQSIQEAGGENLLKIYCHTIVEVVKDVDGNIGPGDTQI